MPIVRPPDLMRYAIASVLAQTRHDFELFLVLDGAPAETAQAANDAAGLDPRIRVFSFPKGERHGEAHRHIALQSASGRYVCQLADDDLWFPEHLEEMEVLLSDYEFGNTLHVFMIPGGTPQLHFGDLGDPRTRARMLTEPFNLFGPSCAGYRIETYRRLPVGWSPAPADLQTDLWMWRKFLRLDGILAGTRFAITMLHFSAHLRPGWSIAQKCEETVRFLSVLRDREQRDRLRQKIWSTAAREYSAREEQLRQALAR